MVKNRIHRVAVFGVCAIVVAVAGACMSDQKVVAPSAQPATQKKPNLPPNGGTPGGTPVGPPIQPPPGNDPGATPGGLPPSNGQAPQPGAPPLQPPGSNPNIVQVLTDLLGGGQPSPGPVGPPISPSPSNPVSPTNPSPPSTPPATPSNPSDPQDAVRTLCMNAINQYRGTIGKSALKMNSQYSKCSDDETHKDGQAGSAHANFGSCQEMAQDECPGYGGGPADQALKECLAQMWAEGPGGGHYENMSGAYSQVSCGFSMVNGSLWMVQNFYP